MDEVIGYEGGSLLLVWLCWAKMDIWINFELAESWEIWDYDLATLIEFSHLHACLTAVKPKTYTVVIVCWLEEYITLKF